MPKGTGINKKNLLPLSFLIFQALWAVICGSSEEGVVPSFFISFNLTDIIESGIRLSVKVTRPVSFSVRRLSVYKLRFTLPPNETGLVTLT